MSKHRCPDHCHKCPDMDGQVMPGCMGTAAMARGPYDMSYCTCARGPSRLTKLERRVARLEEAMETP